MQIPPRLQCPIVHGYCRTKAFDTPLLLHPRVPATDRHEKDSPVDSFQKRGYSIKSRIASFGYEPFRWQNALKFRFAVNFLMSDWNLDALW
ncbi:hypothetical protein CDAR_538921 [Caerostris darwini]|uniref:Uncharacterized protein n=1 Tax=Caerostris darwini TaxID=1538125 RepID=A0AAV4T2Q3_9ARAC|nr:hypothetical protein CDAR_538921 [Caerostris darwini]